MNLSESSFARGKYYQDATQSSNKDKNQDMDVGSRDNSRGPEKKKATDIIPHHVQISPIKRKRKVVSF